MQARTNASCSACKKRGIRSFSAKSRASHALRHPKAKRESASRCSRFPRSRKVSYTTIVSYATTIKGPIVIESHFQTICEQERITNV